jgi:plastocyanin
MTERPDRGASRQSLLLPIVLPVAVLAVIGATLWLFSRVLLQLTHTAAWITALLVAAGILAVSTFIVSRRQITGAAMFSLFGGVLGVTMLVGGAALMIGQESEEEPGGEGPVVLALAAPEGAAVDGYATTELSAPPGLPFTIAFDNQDPGVLHNVALATAEGESPFFEGELITGPAAIDYAIEPLEAADYFFFCTVHPTTMTGTLTVAEGAEPGGGEPGEGPLTVVAKDIAFDTDTIELPADTPSQIVMDNQDGGVPHNIAIYGDDSLSEVLFQGELLTGPAEITYEIPALPAGEYYFQCDVHPNMNGTVIVGGDGGGGGEPPAEPTETASPPEPTETDSPTEPPDDGGGGGGGSGENVGTIVAVNLLFDPTTFTVPAGEPSIVTMDNQDGGIPHNIAIYTDDSASESLFVGELITGPASIDYELPALDAGEYFFRCDVHPTTMVGTVTAA